MHCGKNNPRKNLVLQRSRGTKQKRSSGHSNHQPKVHKKHISDTVGEGRKEKGSGLHNKILFSLYE